MADNGTAAVTFRVMEIWGSCIPISYPLTANRFYP